MLFYEILWAYILVFILAAVPFFEAFAVVPIAFFAGLSAIPVTVLALLGNILTVVLVILLVDKIKAWRRRRRSKTVHSSELATQEVDGGVDRGVDGGVDEDQEMLSKRAMRAKKLWQKYGTPGLAILGPLFVGSHVTAFMSVVLGASKKAATYWMTISITLWVAVIVVLAHFGIDYIRPGEEGFLVRYLNK